MNASNKKSVPLSLIFICAIAACGKSENQGAREPLVVPGARSETATLKLRIEANGISSVYVPRFADGQLVEIQEERSNASGTLHAHYEFRGARLLQYRGAGFGSGDPLKVEFSVEGKLIAARQGEKPAPDEEIAQVLRRAQLLRSHALAQTAIRTHTANH